MASQESTLLLVDPLDTYTVPLRTNCIVSGETGGLSDVSNTSNLQNIREVVKLVKEIKTVFFNTYHSSGASEISDIRSSIATMLNVNTYAIKRNPSAVRKK